MPLQSTIDQRALLDLVKINADLGRFGGLIKMWLTTNADFESLSAQGLQRKLESTLSDVRLLQKKMSDRLEASRGSLKGCNETSTEEPVWEARGLFARPPKTKRQG